MPKGIPEGLHSVVAQLIVDGAEKQIGFCKSAFGATERNRAMDPSGKKVWHSEVRVGDTTFFVNDAMPEMGAPARGSRLWIYSDDVDAMFQRAVAAGAQVTMPLADMFWGDRVGQVTDAWSNQWNLAQRVKNLTPEEMKKAEDEFVAGMAKQQKR